MAVVIVVLCGVVTWRLVQVQVIENDRFESLAMAQRLDTVPIDAARGSVFDRNGSDLALSVRRDSIWANPQVVIDPHGYAAELAPIVGVDESVLVQRLSDRTKEFVYIARAVDDEVADAVRDLDLAGVDFIPEPKRFYPAGDLAAPVLGMVGTEGEGLGGIELLYEDALHGVPGELVLERDRDGRAIPRTVRRQVAAQRGTDLVLTLDQALQYEVEQSLADQVTAVAADGGMAVVMDVTTGDVLAMATVLRGDDGFARPASALDRNRPLTDVYEPGSTNKVVTYAAALEAGVVGPDTMFEVPDWIQVDDRVFTDSEEHPVRQMPARECFAASSNVCTIQIGQALGAERLHDAFDAFGFGVPTDIEFPGQANGIVRDVDEWHGVGLASAAIGYGLAVTPMQMLGAYATIANGGVTVPPRLVEATIDGSGTQIERPIATGRQVLSPGTVATMQSLMTGVVTGGTGSCAAIPGYTVAGKTGTARKIVGGAYSNQHFFASFAGFAPAESPRFAALVVLDEPDYAHRYGGRAAAPVFAEIMQFALRLERVAPPTVDGSAQWDAARAAADAAGTDCAVPHIAAPPADTAATAAGAAESSREAATAAGNVSGGTSPSA
jgi:cell division protein FtsI/penicillin-binding protein 2